jgi:chromosome segregation ATPase
MDTLLNLVPFDIELLPIVVAVIGGAIVIVRLWSRMESSRAQRRPRARVAAPRPKPGRVARPAPAKAAAGSGARASAPGLAETILSRFTTRQRQWQQLAAHIENASSRAEELRRAHDAVGMQLDVAELGLTRLKDELGAALGTREPAIQEPDPAPARSSAREAA